MKIINKISNNDANNNFVTIDTEDVSLQTVKKASNIKFTWRDVVITSPAKQRSCLSKFKKSASKVNNQSQTIIQNGN